MSKRHFGIMGVGFMAAALLFSGTAGAAEIRTYTGHTGGLNSVAFSPDGTKVLTGSIYDPAKLWTTATGVVVRSFTPDSGVNAVAYSPDGTRVLTGSGGNTAKLWNAQTGEALHTFSRGTEGVLAVAFSPDGTRVLAGGDGFNIQTHTPYGAVTLWDAQTGDVAGTFTGHTLAVTSVAFSPDGTRVLTGSLDHTAKLWDAASGGLIQTFAGHTANVSSVAFSPDGTKVLTGSGSPDNTAKLWNASTGVVVQTFNVSSAVQGVAYSPDGTKALTGSVDAVARLWDTATGAVRRTLTGHKDAVTAVAFSADGTMALTGSSDHTAKLWMITVPVPYMTGETQTAAEAMLSSANLTVGTVAQECSNTVAEGSIISQIPVGGTQVDPGSAVALTVSTGLCNVTVPGLTGLTRDAAGTALTGADLVAGTILEQCNNTAPEGTVFSQYPPVGQQVPFGSAVAFAVSTGVCSVTVPSVVGQTQEAAGTALTGADLAVGEVIGQCSNTVPAGVIISQDPESDEQAPFGSTVELVVSTGVCNVTVPGVVGLAQAAAGAALADAGLAAGQVTEVCSNTVAAGTVISQDPPAEQQIPFGGTVALVVSTGLCNVTVPSIAGLTQTAAGAALAGASLVAGQVTGQCSNTVAAGIVLNQFPVADQQAPFGSAVAMTVSTGLCNVTVPNVAGLTQTAAGTALTGADLTPGTVTGQCSNAVAAGLIISQQPAAEEQAPFGSVVTLVVSTGPCSVAVPNVAGLTQAEAGAALADAGLAAGAVTEQCSNTVAAGMVISQQPPANQQALFGSAVALTVSTGPCPAEGEIEGEGEGEYIPPTEAELRDMLTATFDTMDVDRDGQVTYAEALVVVPGLLQTVFNAVDADGNGRISRAEAGLDEGDGGCAGCAGSKGTFTPDQVKKVFGNLFLGGLSLMALLAFRKN